VLKQTFYSNGKLLLTGEYIVLDGAKALALPTKFGQDLNVEPGTDRKILWKSFDSDGSVWFEDHISFDEITAEKDPHAVLSIKGTLIEILHEAFLLNPEFINEKEGYIIETHLTFPKFWGLGTSSTLINNIAQWLGIDAFELLRNSFGGSGYDIACAQNDTPLVYQLVNELPKITPVDFKPGFTENLFFVYLNRKQSSKAAIASYYNNRQFDLQQHIEILDRITENVLRAPNAGVFARELEKHESIMSDIIQMKTAKETFFPDFKGMIKSLGGWGGDFILVVAKENPAAYFRERGFETVIPYLDMILPQ
jgi:mevalonate kinase